MKVTNGFTLIEILVVLFIISIVSTVALLSISHNSNKQIETFANELTQVITLAEEQALLQPAVIGLSFTENSYQFLTYQAPSEKDKTASWIPIQDDVLGKHTIPSDIEVKVVVANAKPSTTDTMDEHEKAQPQIIISTNGDVTPFTIYIGKRDDKPRYVITGEANGTVTNKSLQ